MLRQAIRAKKAGYDGIQIHGAHLYLISQFLSKKYNRRTDEYGGSEEKRAKFLEEIVKKIRAAIGDDMIISAKIDFEDEASGFTTSGLVTTGKILEKAGIDNIDVSGMTVLTSKNKPPVLYNETKELAENVKIPVTCIGGIKTYEQADFAIKTCKIEYVSMVRAFMKDPELVKKWKSLKK